MDKMKFTKLLSMESSRKRPQQGDIFVIQPRLNLFFYGKVIKTNLVSTDSFVNGMSLVYFFRNPVNSIKMPAYLDPKSLLIAPEIVNNQGWIKGYFYTIGNMKVIEEELALDYGFWDVVYKRYCNESGEPLEAEPAIKGTFGLGSYGSVANNVTKELEKYPELLIPISGE